MSEEFYAGKINVLEIIERHLKENGYDGLYHENDCGCEIGKLAPCDSCPLDCLPGYKMPCDCGEHYFHIGEKREK